MSSSDVVGNGSKPGLLSHVRVLDLSRVFAGPWCGQLLADFGADVIKVEHPKGGDDVRHMGVPYKDAEGRDSGETSSYLAMNCGKRSIAIDIGKPAGQRLVRRLAEQCDVVIENFKTGNLKRFGLDYETMSSTNPRLVYCSITGFGQDGPYNHLPGYDPIFQAMSGLMSITGVPDGKPGAGANLVGYSVSDITAGYYAAIAILGALNHRDRVSGRGQYIDLALLDAQLHAVSHIAMNYLASGRMPICNGAASQITCPWQAFDCADMPIMIAVGNDQQFARFAEVLGRPELATDPRFAVNRKRIENSAELVEMLAACLITRNATDWTTALADVGVASGPINNFEQAFADPQIIHREMLKKISHPKVGQVSIVANPVRFSDTPVSYDRHPPLHGEHTRELLRERLDMVDDEIEELYREGILAGK